uniref:Nuclear receptor domain-containing protein n=1 Tax=Bursaphelenchus xylophilus TaxID=6326 RepID=A0A1I7SCP9_BURXY
MMMSNRPLKRRALNLLEPDHLLLDSMTPSTSSVESVGSTTVSSPGANSDGFQSACPICGDGAWNKHFGVLCCNACAAFFRRTVALRKTYLCVRGKRCDVVSGEPRHMCKFCRFQRCIWNGMCINCELTFLTVTFRLEELVVCLQNNGYRSILANLIHSKMLADQYRSSYGPYAQPDIAARSSSAPPAKLPKFPVDERQTHSEDIKMEINYDSNQNIDVVSV